MDFIFNCPNCTQELEVDSSGVGEEIECPSCHQKIRIPEAGAPPPPVPGAAPAPGISWAPGGTHGGSTASSAAAKVEMHLKVPARSVPSEVLITKPLQPLEVAAKESDRKLRIKCIRHIDCVEVGRDRFDEVVTSFLAKIGEQNFISITTLSYSIIDISSQKLLTDFGVMIVYRG
jgi:hypothetical protein